MELSDEQYRRYERNLLIPEIGEAGQKRLLSSRVAIVGLGGLGSALGYYLAAAGVGTLGLIDDDIVEVSNLQRQVLHTTSRLGKFKVESAQRSLHDLNPDVELISVRERLTTENAELLLKDYDVVAEATDNFESKFLINDVCLKLNKPFSTAGILGLIGQALFVVPNQTPCLRCVFPSIPEQTPTTKEVGVLGAVPGILGSVQALEIVRWLVGLWKVEPNGCGKLHGVDGLAMTLRSLRVAPRQNCMCRTKR